MSELSQYPYSGLTGAIGDGSGLLMRSVEAVPVDDDDPVAKERADSLPDACEVQIYRRYSRGKQHIDLTNEQKETLAGLPYTEFADNVVGQIQNINKDRLKVTDFEVAPPRDLGEAEGQRAAEEVKEHIDIFRVKCRFDAEQNKINKAVLRDGNHAVGLAWDEDTQRVLLFQEPWWDGFSGMYVAYGANGLIAYAVKEWIGTESPESAETAAKYRGSLGLLRKFYDQVTGAYTAPGSSDIKSYRYRTIYYPGKVLKYRQSQDAGGKWEKYEPEGEPPIISWVKRDGSPLGVPVIHFSVGGDGHYGETVTPLAVLANQDFLNDTRLDAQGVARQTGFQRIAMTGWESYEMGANGQLDLTRPIQYLNLPGIMWVTPNPAARVQVLEPGDPAGLLSIHNLTVESMCRQTQTPIYLLSLSANMSGAAILRAEAPLAGKAQEQTESLGPSYAMLMHRAIEIYNAKNKDGITLNEDAMITPVWADTSKPDAMAVLEFDKAKFENERAEMVLELERKAIEEGRPVYLAPDDSSRRLATVTIPAEEQLAAA